MALIIGALCFSVGEGLRLTPFPVPHTVEEPNVLSTAEAAKSASLLKYGPLDVPSQSQKRGKRQAPDFAFHASAESRPPVTLTWYFFEVESTPLRSALFVSRPLGRAPPLLS